MSTAFIHHSDCLRHDMGAHHPECPARLGAVEDQLIASGLIGALDVHDAPLAIHILPLHPRDILDRATTLEPDFAPPVPATPRRRRSTALWAVAPLLFAAGVIMWSMRPPEVPPSTGAPIFTKQEHATPRTIPEETPSLPPTLLADSPDLALTQAAETLTACAREARREASIEVKTSPGTDHFTSIDIDCKSTAGAACVRGVLATLRFHPPTVENTYIAEYWP